MNTITKKKYKRPGNHLCEIDQTGGRLGKLTAGLEGTLVRAERYRRTERMKRRKEVKERWMGGRCVGGRMRGKKKNCGKEEKIDWRVDG